MLNGRTSSGKTFTIFGSETDPGIIHQAVRDVFDRIQMVMTYMCFLNLKFVAHCIEFDAYCVELVAIYVSRCHTGSF